MTPAAVNTDTTGIGTAHPRRPPTTITNRHINPNVGPII